MLKHIEDRNHSILELINKLKTTSYRIEAIINFLRGKGKRSLGNSQRKIVGDRDRRKDKDKGKSGEPLGGQMIGI